MASGSEDESRLLRGKALVLAEEWAKNKSLSYQDREFLAASKNLEIESKNREAQIERERKDKEAVEQRNQVLSSAYQEAQKKIRLGRVVLIATGLAAIISASLAAIEGHRVIQAEIKLSEIKEQTENVDKLSELSGKLLSANKSNAASLAREYIGLSYAIKDHELKQAFLLASISLACQNLGQNFCNEVQEASAESLKLLQEQENLYTSAEGAQVGVFAYYIQGQLFSEQKKSEKAIEVYTKAFNLLEKSKYNPYEPNIPTKILSEGNVESVHLRLIELLSPRPHQENLRSQVIASLKNHYEQKKDNYIRELGKNLVEKKWKEADRVTWSAIFYSAKTKNIDKLYFDWDNVSCKDLKKIDQLWLQSSNNFFGLSVQKRIYTQTGNQLEQYNKVDWKRFIDTVGWTEEDKLKEYKDIYDDLKISSKEAPMGHLPWFSSSDSTLLNLILIIHPLHQVLTVNEATDYSLQFVETQTLEKLGTQIYQRRMTLENSMGQLLNKLAENSQYSPALEEIRKLQEEDKQLEMQLRRVDTMQQAMKTEVASLSRGVCGLWCGLLAFTRIEACNL